MALNIIYPDSVNVGFFISLSWSNTFNDDYFTISRQINNSSTWQGVPYPPNSNLTRFGDTVDTSWNRVRYRIRGFPSGTESITNWITVIGGTGPVDPVDPDPIEPDPILTVPNFIVPHTVSPGASFEVRWSDSNVGATYDIEEEVNNGNWVSLATNRTSKSYPRIALSTWNNVRYRVRAKKGSETTLWAYSIMITVERLFPQMSVKVGTAVRNSVDGWVMVNGTLRKITDIWVKTEGVLKKLS